MGEAYITLSNCESWGNNDSQYKQGDMADGFAVKQELGPGNKLIGGRAWNNIDDGYDTFGDDENAIVFERCWAFNNGYGEEADFNGFLRLIS